METTTDPLAAHLAAALVQAQHSYRTRRGFGAYVTPRIPADVISGFAEALAPVVRGVVAEAIAEQRQETRP